MPGGGAGTTNGAIALKVTVGIKALNEERHIARTLQSAIDAVAPYGGEVVLADSGSSDRTIEIASAFPVTIVQLANHAERCCGAGAQLAFQHARGEFFYLLDGDMVLDPGFLPAGLAFLEANPQVAGVGGRVREVNTESHEFQIRADTVARGGHWAAGIVDRLDCGGLYRASAIRDAGYFADRNLHAFEEFELGARLQANGWKLARVDVPAVDHYGHRLDGYRLLWKRFRSGYSGATGEVLRGALGHPHLGVVLRRLAHIRHDAVVILWWLALLACLFSPLSAPGKLALLIALIGSPLAFLSWRRGSLKLGLYSFAAWNVGALGLLTGLFRARKPPQDAVASVTLKSTP